MGLLLLLFIVTCSYFLRIAVLNIREGDPQYHCVSEYFSSIQRTMATLTETMCHGFDWTLEITHPLLHPGTEVAACVWILYIIFQAVAMGMVVPGMFIEELMEAAADSDQETQKASLIKYRLNLPDMAKIFRQLDRDGDHRINREEFFEGIRSNEDVQALFNVDEEDIDELFFALDEHGTGEVWIDDFILGAIRIRCGTHSIANMSFDWSSRRATRVLELCYPTLKMMEATLEEFSSERDLAMSTLIDKDFGKYMPEAIQSADQATQDQWKLKHCMLDHPGALMGEDIAHFDRLEAKIKVLVEHFPCTVGGISGGNSGISGGNWDEAQALLTDAVDLHHALEKAAQADASYSAVLAAAVAQVNTIARGP